MTKIIVKKRYATIPNDILSNPNLSRKAKGLWAYIQSKPDDYDFAVDRIIKETKDGRESTRQGLIELEEHGLLIRKKFHNKNGTWAFLYELHEKSTNNKKDNKNIKKQNKNDEMSGCDCISEETSFKLPPSEKMTEGNLTEGNLTINKKRNNKKEIIKKKYNNISTTKVVDVGEEKKFFANSFDETVGTKNFTDKTPPVPPAPPFDRPGLEKTVQLEKLERQETTEIKTEQLLQTKEQKKEEQRQNIIKLIDFIKGKYKEYGILYSGGSDDRQFAKNLLSKSRGQKNYLSLGMNIEDYLNLIIYSSTQGYTSDASSFKAIYYNAGKIYNQIKKKYISQKNDKDNQKDVIYLS